MGPKPPEPAAPASVVAVAYARMSTDVQNHSIQHQLDRINAYAAAQGMTIVRTFVDEGRSGLSLATRPGLQALLAQATGPAPDFSVIVVYDVSRWGRFQDTDESAFYEYLCRRAGVAVVYCAEQFSMDGSPMAALLKGIKRIMAAEYSRELSDKVFLAQSRFVRMGYKQGGRPGYGLQRVPIGLDGDEKTPLLPGQRKPMPTDRVALVPGSEGEVALVRRIYHLYTELGWSDSRIATVLAAEGRSTHMGRAWDPPSVRRILTNRRYYGELVFNQTSRRLGGLRANNPESAWVRREGALQGMVGRAEFERAQQIRMQRALGPQRDDILARLRELYREHGTINEALCCAARLPGHMTIHKLFGGYVQAYVAAGLPASRTATGALGIRSMRAVVDEMLDSVFEMVPIAGGTVEHTNVWNIVLLNGGLRLKVSVASCRHYPDGGRRWRVALLCGAKADFVVCALMDVDNVAVERYLLLPTAQIGKASVHLSARRAERYRSFMFETLAEVFGLRGA